MNNYQYQNYYWVQNRNNFDPYLNNNMDNTKLYNPKEGFERGNLFQNLYSEYKNYQPMNVLPKTEQEKKRYELQAMCFAAHELNLYLDTHPNDQSMMSLLNDYRRKAEDLTKAYEEKYGPLTVSSSGMENSAYSWIESPWPWEVK